MPDQCLVSDATSHQFNLNNFHVMEETNITSLANGQFISWFLHKAP